MDQNYYKEYYYLERKHWWFLARSKILSAQVKNALKGIKHPKILNIGAATGASSQMLSCYGEVTSLEFDLNCCLFLEEELKIKAIHGSVTKLPFNSESFDLVCAFDVIEHVQDDVLAVSEMIRVTSSTGKILISVPAFMSLWSEHDVINQHFRRYRSSELKALFKHHKKDGEIKFTSYFNSFLFIPIYFARKIFNLFAKKKKPSESLQSDFTRFKEGLFNSLLYRFFLSENFFLKRTISFPVGVSILLCWTKSNKKN